MRRLLLRFLQMDRRWIFLGMGFAILIPMLYPVDLPFRVDERVRAVYDAIEELEPGSRVLISADFDPAGLPEIGPFFRANLHHLMRQDIKIVVLCLWEFAPPIVVSYLDEVSPSYDYEYGTDYAFLGYKPGQELAIKAIGENITKAFPSDYRGAPLSELPIMQGLKQARDFDLLVLVSAGSPGTREYVLQIQGPARSAHGLLHDRSIGTGLHSLLQGRPAGGAGCRHARVGPIREAGVARGGTRGSAQACHAGSERTQSRPRFHHRSSHRRQRRLLSHPPSPGGMKWSSPLSISSVPGSVSF